MTPKQVALVRDSFAKVALTSEAAAVLFMIVCSTSPRR
jgi:hypothetical protein